MNHAPAPRMEESFVHALSKLKIKHIDQIMILRYVVVRDDLWCSSTVVVWSSVGSSGKKTVNLDAVVVAQNNHVVILTCATNWNVDKTEKEWPYRVL